jgi:hypothetical protein
MHARCQLPWTVGYVPGIHPLAADLTIVPEVVRSENSAIIRKNCVTGCPLQWP